MLGSPLGQIKPECLNMGPGYGHFSKLLIWLLRFGYHNWVSGTSDGSLLLQETDAQLQSTDYIQPDSCF